MAKRKKKKKQPSEKAQRDEDGFRRFMTELEELEEGHQELIKTIVEKIFEALKERNVIAFASTPASMDINKEVLKAAYHISNLVWKHEQ